MVPLVTPQRPLGRHGFLDGFLRFTFSVLDDVSFSELGIRELYQSTASILLKRLGLLQGCTKESFKRGTPVIHDLMRVDWFIIRGTLWLGS